MRRTLMTIALLLCASAQAAWAQYATIDGFALRFLSHQALVRSALGTQLPPERSVSQVGLELALPTAWRPLRVEARFLGTQSGRNDLRSIDAGFVLGWRTLGVAAALGRRGSYDPSSGLAQARDATFGRLGLRLLFGAPESSFIIHLRGDSYLALRQNEGYGEDIDGGDAEGGVTWRAPKAPLTATVGYRLERFRIFGVEQEVSALTFGFGVAMGGR